MCCAYVSCLQTVFLPIAGLVPPSELKPGDLVGTNKDSYLILEKLPVEYDSRVRAMEVDERPQEDYNDIGGLDKQIQELVEAVVLPMTHADQFAALGVKPPKGERNAACRASSARRCLPCLARTALPAHAPRLPGVLLYGPPGTGKTLLARACAKRTDAVFLKLAAPQLVQMFIGDGAKVRRTQFLRSAAVGLVALTVLARGQMVRDAFALAKEKVEQDGRAGAIIFIDEARCSARAPVCRPPLRLTACVLTSRSWTPLAQSGSTATSRATARCSARCWSC